MPPLLSLPAAQLKRLKLGAGAFLGVHGQEQRWGSSLSRFLTLPAVSQKEQDHFPTFQADWEHPAWRQRDKWDDFSKLHPSRSSQNSKPRTATCWGQGWAGGKTESWSVTHFLRQA